MAYSGIEIDKEMKGKTCLAMQSQHTEVIRNNGLFMLIKN